MTCSDKQKQRYALQRIREAWSKWKRPVGAEITSYDWGFADGVKSCMSLFEDKLRRPDNKGGPSP